MSGSKTEEGMRFKPDKCPECGEEAIGTLDTIQARADFEKNADGSFSYSGHTEMFYDTQQTNTDDGKMLLLCENGHDWPADLVKKRSPKRKPRNKTATGH